VEAANNRRKMESHTNTMYPRSWYSFNRLCEDHNRMEPSPESSNSKLGLHGPEGVTAPTSPLHICGSNLNRCSCELTLHGTWHRGVSRVGVFDLQSWETISTSPTRPSIAPRANLPSQPTPFHRGPNHTSDQSSTMQSASHQP